tara:strand:+ start:6391 stop:6750 length:360 start_codon:yes stop_codon:yes gene_type:complete
MRRPTDKNLETLMKIKILWPILFATTFTPAVVSAGEDPEFGALFIAPGVEETFYTCTACHSERIVAQQGLSRDKWVDMLDWMVEEQGMQEIEEPDYTVIVDYLSEHYGIDRPNFPAPMN